MITLDSKEVIFKSKQELSTCVVNAPDIIDLGEITLGIDDLAPKVEHIYHPNYFAIEFECFDQSGASGKNFWVELTSPGAPWATVSGGGATFVKMNSGSSSDLSLYIGLRYDQGDSWTAVYDNDVKWYMGRINSNVDSNSTSKFGMCTISGGAKMNCYFGPIVKLVKNGFKKNNNPSREENVQKNNNSYEQIITFSVVYN